LQEKAKSTETFEKIVIKDLETLPSPNLVLFYVPVVCVTLGEVTLSGWETGETFPLEMCFQVLLF